MGYNYDVSVKTTNTKSKSNHLQTLTHIELEKFIPINHAIENLDFFDIDDLFNDYITNHNKNIDINLVNCDFKLVFNNEFCLHIKPELQNNLMEYHL